MLKKALAGAAAIAIGGMIGLSQQNQQTDSLQRNYDFIQEHPHREQTRNEIETLAATAKAKYKIDDAFATHVATLAKKYKKSDFPKAKDIMAVVGIESSFNPNAKSGLRIDPARGLTQLRPRVWGLDYKKDLATPEQQIAKGAEILSTYHKKFDGDADKALHAYNIGITNLKRGTGLNPKYVDKFHQERKLYD